MKLLFYGTSEDESLHMLIGLARIQSENESIYVESHDYDSENEIEKPLLNRTISSAVGRNNDSSNK